ncbi:DNA-binding protein HU-beta [Novimethylophilus kurashikiensis]|uniref:DNA-binding protein HU-beta n=1 Tax=Novimethylophilus kurashikiensis TaxID=1825523 RepID=A0A2R5F513_9PROT|nr:HU family DNA-binding protein [Novimethylophilus kurashikiensis]GBG12778.1 DNA-binding protein HU-beta [Novimethylophilus kurashikiensis]
MNKTELIDAISAKVNGVSKASVAAVVDATVATISDALKSGDKVQLIGFGTFETRARAAREGRNPKTGEKLKIAASKTPAFSAGKALKDAVNK